LSAELAAEEQRLTDIRPETSPEEFRELADAFDTRVQQIRRDFERRSRDLERDRERLPIEFLAQVDEIVLELMRESDGVVLLDLRTVILRADVIDITDRAIDRIDAAFDTGAPSDNSARQE
jgi:Skp family chaperone for outer membrane proteins